MHVKEWLIAVLEVAGSYFLFALLQWAWGRRGLLRRVAWGLNLAVLSGAIYYFLGELLAGIHIYLALVFKAAFLFFAALVTVRMTDWLFFEAFSGRRKARPVPVVLRDIGCWLVLAGLLFLIIRTIFPAVNLNVLAFSSLVVGYIVANATQDTLGNLVAGLALNTETPFQIGDWVNVGGHTGQVVDMTWRATRLCTKNADHIIIPNSCISREPISNYSRPTPVHAQSFMIGASYDAPPKKVRDVLLETFKTVPGIQADPHPRVYLTGYGDFAIQYRVKYFVTDYETIDQIESDAMDLVWYAFRREGIGIPFPIRDVRLRTISADDEARTERVRREEIGQILRGTDLFAPVPGEEIDYLASQFQEALYARGECLVTQGEAGNSFFLIRSGRVSVVVRDESGRESVVARLEPSGYFGEMSLLTGAPRTATVRAETDTAVLILAHTEMADALRRNPRLAEIMATILEQRNQGLNEHRAARKGVETGADSGRSAGALLEKIRSFFKLRGTT
jgi:small-conductance mechanosensitive channel/CRP-like cAMP-binding protein